MWSTLVAVTLVVAGARASTAQASSSGHSELHAAKCLRIAPALRRAHDQARPLHALVAVTRVALPPVTRRVVPAEHRAAASRLGARSLFVRSSRGPPRA